MQDWFFSGELTPVSGRPQDQGGHWWGWGGARRWWRPAPPQPTTWVSCELVRPADIKTPPSPKKTSESYKVFQLVDYERWRVSRVVCWSKHGRDWSPEISKVFLVFSIYHCDTIFIMVFDEISTSLSSWFYRRRIENIFYTTSPSLSTFSPVNQYACQKIWVNQVDYDSIIIVVFNINIWSSPLLT